MDVLGMKFTMCSFPRTVYDPVSPGAPRLSVHTGHELVEQVPRGGKDQHRHACTFGTSLRAERDDQNKGTLSESWLIHTG